MNSKVKNLPKEDDLVVNPQEMVLLRKQGSSLQEISVEFGLTIYQVSTILKEELGDTYGSYSLRKKWDLTPEEIDNIITLRRSYLSIDKIAKQCNIPSPLVSKMISKELKEEEILYLRPNSYENVKKQSKEKVQEIINLRNLGNSISDIEDKTGFKKGFITWFLSDMPDEHLKCPQIRDNKNIRSEENVLAYLNEIYDNISAKILTLEFGPWKVGPAYNKERKKFRTLKPSCTSEFISMWNSLPSSTTYRTPDIICLPFVYCFLRSSNIFIDSTLLLSRYDHNKHKWFGSLKRIQNHLPGYIRRDRKQVVLEKIKEVMNFFKLSDRFYHNAKIIMEKLWNYIKNTTDNVIVGTISTLSLFSISNDTVYTDHICQRIGITHSAVIYQITNKVIKPLKISGFTTLAASKELLQKELLEKIIK